MVSVMPLSMLMELFCTSGRSTLMQHPFDSFQGKSCSHQETNHTKTRIAGSPYPSRLVNTVSPLIPQDQEHFLLDRLHDCATLDQENQCYRQ